MSSFSAKFALFVAGLAPGVLSNSVLADIGYCPSTNPHSHGSDSTCRSYQHVLKSNSSEFLEKSGDITVEEILNVNQSPHWSFPPSCVYSNESSTEYCLYTSREFANNRGISIWATPREAARILRLPAFAYPEVLEGVNVYAPMYEAKKLPGRGIGLVATRTIHRGERLFTESPLTLYQVGFNDIPYEERTPAQKLGVDRLPANASKLFMDLHVHRGEDHVNDVIRTNAYLATLFPYEGQGEEFEVVLPDLSRINHDCRPNLHYYFDDLTLTQQVHATRTISPGEELTVTYIDPLKPRDERLGRLMHNWGFDCSCSVCSLPDGLSAASDQRIGTVLHLEEHLLDRNASSLATPAMAEQLVSLYEQERLFAHSTYAYAYAAFEHNGVGNVYEAVKYAHKGLEAALILWGPEFYMVDEMQEIIRTPKRHWSWRFRAQTKEIRRAIQTALKNGKGKQGKVEELEKLVRKAGKFDDRAKDSKDNKGDKGDWERILDAIEKWLGRGKGKELEGVVEALKGRLGVLK